MSDESYSGAKKRRNGRGEDDSAAFDVAMKRFAGIVGSELDKENREAANEDIRFVYEPGGQWDNYSRDNWKGRPKMEVNQIQPMINVVMGDQRESDLTSRVIPLGDGATKKMADVLNGLVRSINSQNNFDEARDNAFREAITCGFGAWGITTDWCEDDPWVQDFKVYPIRSAINSVHFDPGSVKECNEDAKYCFVSEWITKEEFKSRYGDEDPVDVPTDTSVNYHDQWYTGDKVRISDYWCKKPVEKRIGLFSREVADEKTGEISIEQRTWEIDDKILDELAIEGWEMVREKTVKSHKVVHRKMSGNKFLTGEKEWVGKHIPVVPCYGYQNWLDGSRRFWGMVRFAKDSQRIYNYAWNSVIHTLSKAPKDPYWVTRKQMQNPADANAVANMAQRDDPVMFYTNDEENPGPPKRTGGSQVPAAMMGVLAEATQNVQRVTGKFASSQGDNPMDQSGRAVLALQKQGDLGTYVLVDNLAKSIRRHTEILIDAAPRTYDTERQLRITQADGNTMLVKSIQDQPELVNTEIVDLQTGETVLLVDLSMGRYDVSEDIGASYSSRRQEALQALAEISHNNPQAGMLIMDEMIKLMDFRGTDEAVKRIQQFMVKQGLREPTKEEIIEAQERAQAMGPQEPSPQELLMLENAKADLTRKALENDQLELENEKIKLEIGMKQQDGIAKAATTEKTIAEAEKVEAQTAQIRKETAQPQTFNQPNG